MARWLAIAAVLCTAAGCGGDDDATPDGTTTTRERPAGITCASLQTREAAHKLARTLVDRVVAPEGHPERETIGVIGESLYATCRQPRLPGVKDPLEYEPVGPVLRNVQRHFDQDEIAGH